MARAVHTCGCEACQKGEWHVEQEWHTQMNLIMSRMDEQQRRWYAAAEAKRLGHGGIRWVAQITGLAPKTIRRGQRELGEKLNKRPTDRVRLPGGGRPKVEKKMLILGLH